MNQETKSNRYLIAIGSPNSPNMSVSPLKRVESDIQRVVNLFVNEEQGYQRVLAEQIPLSAPAQQIRSAMNQWFASSERKSSDVVLIYYAGHGGEAGKFKNYYLFTSDMNERELPNSGIKTRELVEIFFEGSGKRPRNILLILDTCYSGQGGIQAFAALGQADTDRQREMGLYVLAAADPATEAGDGAFVDALSSVMDDESWMPKGGNKSLPLYDLKKAINAYFKREKLPQEAVDSHIGNPDEYLFIRNPRFTRRFDGLELADRVHWEEKARGVEGMASPGWFFKGRENALCELVRWLKAETSDLKARVVTGGPGSGKSAVLGRLVTCAHPETRKQMQREGALGSSPDLLPDIGSIDAVLYAHGVNLSGMIARLAEQLQIEDNTLEGVLKELAGRRKPARILVDALDEADNPFELENELLSKLAVCPAVRLIVGTRKRNDVAPLAGVNKVVDLDTPEYFSELDLAAYVTARLIRRTPPSVYADAVHHADAERIGQFVAQKAGHSFLYARIVSRWLASADAPVDTTKPDWESSLKLPEDLTEAFGQDLGRFPEETRKRFFGLLVPLAYARGKGLPQKNLWHTLASGMAGREYHNSDIRELKAQAGYYLVQDTEHDETVYRLFHQTFADYLKEQTRDEDVERVITDTLIEWATPSGAQKPDWEQLREPYLLHYLPAHAAAVRGLDKLIADPEFLLAMPPESLLLELHRLPSARRKIAACYRKASHHLRAAKRQSKYPYLLLSALQYGADDLAEGLRKLNLTARWEPEWGWWQQSLPSEVAVTTDEKLWPFIIAESDDGQPVAVTAAESDDGQMVAFFGRHKINVWDLRTGQKLGQSNSFPGSISCLTAAQINEQQVVISGWDDGSIRIFALASGALLQQKEQAHTQSVIISKSADVTDLCIAQLGNQTVLASAGHDQAIRLWKLPDLQLLTERPLAHNDWIYHLAATRLGETTLLISGSDSISGRDGDPTAMVRLWRLPDLSLIDEINRDKHVGYVSELKMFTFEGKPTLLIRYGFGGEIELWDVAEIRKLADLRAGIENIAVIDWRGELLITGKVWSQFRKLKIRPASNKPGELPYQMEFSGDPVKISEDKWSPPFEVLGRMVFASVGSGKIRIWDADELLEGALKFEDDPLYSVAASEVCVAGGSYYGTLRVWNSQTGAIKWTARIADSALSSLAITKTADRNLLVAGDLSGHLRVYDLEAGQPIHDPIQAGERLESLTTFEFNGAAFCAAAVNMKPMGSSGEYVVRIWNLETGKEYDTHVSDDDSKWRVGSEEYTEWALTLPSKYMRAKTLECVAVDFLNNVPVVIAGGPHGEIYKWKLPTLKIAETNYHSSSIYVRSLKTGDIRGQKALLFGLDNGMLNLMGLASGEILQSVLHAHQGEVSDVAFAEIESQLHLFSCGADGVVKIWSPDLEELHRIEIEDRVVGLAPLADGRVAVATSRAVIMLKLRSQL